MKKFLLSFLLSFSILQMTQAQVIELIGIGVKDVDNPVLYIPDPGSVDHVVVEAAGIFRENAVPSSVKFFDSNEWDTVQFQLAETDLAPPVLNGASQKWGYYTTTFNDVDAGGITLDKQGNVDANEEIVSFTAYVYRTGGSGIHSEAKGDHAFLFRNGSVDPLEYTFTIPFSFSPRDVVISMPFSDVNADGRYSIIDVTPSGMATTHVEFDDNNQGALLHIETITIPNVPGNVTEVVVSAYSPNPDNGIDTKNGDSFITSAILLTTTFDQGCTLTQGYWKTHADPTKKKYDETWDQLPSGPGTVFFLSGQTWLEVFDTQPKGNAYYILAHQYMAAALNVLNGSYAPSEVVTAILDATSLFNTYSPADIAALGGGDVLRDQFIALGELLDDYNNGELGPTHCDDYESSEKSAVIDNSLEFSEFSVYPNPVRGNATLSFNPNFDGNATVDVYNSMGQKALTLYNQNVKKNIPVSVMFDGNQLNEGLYVITLQNGINRESIKIQVSK
ncbi:T9SS type A sorting domain-containing protein [Maribellus comscasis]|uniref:T9SS type A sorting domain-containing protein n=1 Tax=Maribellus comscasis TaxID=2681766 RepID=A0A6I6JM28_9BACT|nr:T9SS type A sorting domain-containing protein [Maribellus comscasis]QGY43926.1 T9SS type A sorting domain-containing protein [Maribellus comscasis]